MSAIGFYLLYAFAWTVSLLPYWLLYRISDVLYLINYHGIGYRKKVVFGNLRKVFPDKTETEIEKIARAFYRHLCDFLVETIKIISVTPEKHDKRFVYKNLELIQELQAANRSFALVLAHYNNWEWMIFLPSKMVHKFLAIYRPLNNKAVDRLSQAIRGRAHPILVPMETVYRAAVNLRNEQKLFMIYFLADQRPPRTSRYWTRFLNQEVAFYDGVEKLSRKLQLAVVFADIKKTGRGRYEAHLKKLFDNAAETSENEVMHACVREMENEILRQPEFWLWSHNRFKHSRPESISLIEP